MPDTTLKCVIECMLCSDLFKDATPDVVVSQGAPKFPKLVCKACEASPDDGPHVQRCHLIRVLGDQVTQLMPQLSRETKIYDFQIENTRPLAACFKEGTRT